MLPTGGSEPPLRRESPGATDGTHMYVFGGQSGNSGGSRLNDLWQFDGQVWTQMTANGAAGSPPARTQAGVTWDTARGRLVVFGGNDAAGAALADTWEWDPNTNAWTNQTQPGSPPARRFTSIAYDPNSTGIVLFGGLDSSGAHLNDTWLLFGGSAWVQMTPTTIPSTRRQHHLVTRPDIGDVLLVGGQDASLSAPTKWRRDVHSWDGAEWTLIPTTTDPQGVVANSATYDEARQRLVMPSGNGGTPANQFNGVSEFDSLTNDWVIRPGLGYFSRFFLAYVPALGKTIKVSGQGNLVPTSTYDYQSVVPAAAPAAGSGCGGMLLDSDTLPWTGRSWSLTGSGFASGALGAMIFGFGTQSTPLSTFTPAAGAGCDLLVTTDSVLLLFPAGGQANYAFQIPNDPTFAGLGLNGQMLSLETSGSSITSLTSTNAIAGVIGAL
ncbi:MAG: hypothetical protein NXI31_00960 [bacterium]|nr:hypothetical protein [bacterium]